MSSSMIAVPLFVTLPHGVQPEPSGVAVCCSLCCFALCCWRSSVETSGALTFGMVAPSAPTVPALRLARAGCGILVDVAPVTLPSSRT